MFLIDGFKYGFHLFSVGQSTSYESPNLLSARQQPQVVDQKLAKELEAHRLAAPFDTPPFPVFRVSPLGKKTPGELRLIHHLSYPKGKSVNDGISHEHSSVQYANIDHAIKKIKQSGVGSYLAKTDIKNAFRILPINPHDYHLLGMKWSGQYYYDKCMPMGCSSSCKTFENFSTAVEWIAQDKLGIANLIHLLDDFLLLQTTESQCSQLPVQCVVQRMLSRPPVNTRVVKDVLPVTMLIQELFLGVFIQESVKPTYIIYCVH